jgi:hypothetical protein
MTLLCAALQLRQVINCSKSSLSFAVKDLGNLSYFLGIDATVQKNGLLLTQQKYIGDLLLKANMVSCSPTPTPMFNTENLSREEGTLLS